MPDLAMISRYSLAALAGCSASIELSRPGWLAGLNWRSRYPSPVLGARGAGELVAFGLLLWPHASPVAAVALLIVLWIAAAVALLIDGESRIASLAVTVAVVAAVTGFFNVR